MVIAKINGQDREFDTQEAADQALADAKVNADNFIATRQLLAAAVGGSKYKAESQALAFTRNVLADVLADATDDNGAKLKPKDLDNATIARHVLGMSEEDFIKRARNAYKLVVQPINVLTTSPRIQMKGGLYPADVAAEACKLIRPESAAAAKSAATARISSALGN